MEFHPFRYFVTVVETRNVTRAAQMYGVCQPPHTRAIRRLGDILGGPLLRHEGRRTHLTGLGRMVRPRREQTRALTEAARAEALDCSRMVNATLTLGCMCTFAPTRAISLSGVLGRRSRPSRCSPRAMSSRPRAGHRFEGMDCARLAAVDGEGYPRRVDRDDLDSLAAAGHVDSIETGIRFRSAHESRVQAMVIAGRGCAILPESRAEPPALRSHRPAEPAISRTVPAVTRRGRKHMPAVGVLVRPCRGIDWGRSAE